jgi:hypothetical protein
MLWGSMAETESTKSGLLPDSIGETGEPSLGGLRSFRIIGLSIFAFAAVYVVSLDVTEILLQRHFESKVEEALRVSPADGPIVSQI